MSFDTEKLKSGFPVNNYRVSLVYSRFQVTFHCNIPNFVAKFGNSWRSSKVHFRIRKPVCKLSIWLALLSSGANHSLCLQTGLWILKWTFELRNELPNFGTNFRTSQRSSEYYSEKLSGIDCKTFSLILICTFVPGNLGPWIRHQFFIYILYSIFTNSSYWKGCCERFLKATVCLLWCTISQRFIHGPPIVVSNSGSSTYSF